MMSTASRSQTERTLHNKLDGYANFENLQQELTSAQGTRVRCATRHGWRPGLSPRYVLTRERYTYTRFLQRSHLGTSQVVPNSRNVLVKTCGKGFFLAVLKSHRRQRSSERISWKNITKRRQAGLNWALGLLYPDIRSQNSEEFEAETKHFKSFSE